MAIRGGGKPTTPINSKGHKNGGIRPGQGRPKGSMNMVAAAIRDVASKYTEAAIEKAAEMAGLKTAPVYNKRTGTFVLGKDGKPLMKLQPAVSESARIAAMGIILERGGGKAVQPMANDPDNPLMAPVGKLEMEIVAPVVGAPSNDDAPQASEPGQTSSEEKLGCQLVNGK